MNQTSGVVAFLDGIRSGTRQGVLDATSNVSAHISRGGVVYWGFAN